MHRSPTYAQQNVLDALVRVTRDGWPATVREVMRAAGLASSATAHGHLVMLERDGHVAKHPRCPAGGWLPVLDEQELDATLLRRVA